MVKRMNIADFRDLGFLQEANRLFFHPLGLALEVVVDNDTGVITLGGIWDFRYDPEGVIYGIENGVINNFERGSMCALKDMVETERLKHEAARKLLFNGVSIEPLTIDLDKTTASDVLQKLNSDYKEYMNEKNREYGGPYEIRMCTRYYHMLYKLLKSDYGKPIEVKDDLRWNGMQIVRDDSVKIKLVEKW